MQLKRIIVVSACAGLYFFSHDAYNFQKCNAKWKRSKLPSIVYVIQRCNLQSSSKVRAYFLILQIRAITRLRTIQYFCWALDHLSNCLKNSALKPPSPWHQIYKNVTKKIDKKCDQLWHVLRSIYKLLCNAVNILFQ